MKTTFDVLFKWPFKDRLDCCKVYDVYLFNRLFTKFLLDKQLVVNMMLILIMRFFLKND